MVEKILDGLVVFMLFVLGVVISALLLGVLVNVWRATL
jgi:hypothetical protein